MIAHEIASSIQNNVTIGISPFQATLNHTSIKIIHFYRFKKVYLESIYLEGLNKNKNNASVHLVSKNSLLTQRFIYSNEKPLYLTKAMILKPILTEDSG
ncbi:MAG: hypothetical protein GY696_37065 [Gammaproteobacteria bacterium]|nr:hypothetical protein [Gammaproteobacteria bacterium]